MFLPVRTDSPLRRTPYTNWALIAANIVLFFAGTIHPMWGSVNWWEGMALNSGSPTVFGFITSQFAHAGIAHLLGNMLFLYIFGNHVNDKLGHAGYLAFYLAGGVVAAMSFVLSEPKAVGLVGASGSIAAVTGAYLVLFPSARVTIVYWFYLIGRYEIQSLWLILLFFAQDVFFNFAGQDGVAHMAHIGGTIFGAIVCLIMLAVRLLPRDQFDVWALAVRWNKRRQYRDMVARGFDPFTGTAKFTEEKKRRPPGVTDEAIHDLRHRINAAVSVRQFDVAADGFLQLIQLDPTQTLSRQAMADIATHLHHQNRFADAATAYEKLLDAYPNFDQSSQIELAVGVICGRYLDQLERARRHLRRAVERLHEGREHSMAVAELADVESRMRQPAG